jgi:hypothetical protein
METTVGQLNFFKWAIETGILDYIVSNKDKLEREMRSSSLSSSKKLGMQEAKQLKVAGVGGDGGGIIGSIIGDPYVVQPPHDIHFST